MIHTPRARYLSGHPGTWANTGEAVPIATLPCLRRPRLGPRPRWKDSCPVDAPTGADLAGYGRRRGRLRLLRPL